MTGNYAAACYPELIANECFSPSDEDNDQRDYLTHTLEACERVSLILGDVSDMAECMLRYRYGMLNLWSSGVSGLSLTGWGRKKGSAIGTQ